jgi:hypothetical protein
VDTLVLANQDIYFSGPLGRVLNGKIDNKFEKILSDWFVFRKISSEGVDFIIH